MGSAVGAAVGSAVGAGVGVAVGSAVGAGVGVAVGAAVGSAVGAGVAVGFADDSALATAFELAGSVGWRVTPQPISNAATAAIRASFALFPATISCSRSSFRCTCTYYIATQSDLQEISRIYPR